MSWNDIVCLDLSVDRFFSKGGITIASPAIPGACESRYWMATLWRIVRRIAIRFIYLSWWWVCWNEIVCLDLCIDWCLFKSVTIAWPAIPVTGSSCVIMAALLWTAVWFKCLGWARMSWNGIVCLYFSIDWCLFKSVTIACPAIPVTGNSCVCMAAFGRIAVWFKCLGWARMSWNGIVCLDFVVSWIVRDWTAICRLVVCYLI